MDSPAPLMDPDPDPDHPKGMQPMIYGEEKIKSNCQKVCCYMGLAILSKAKWKLKNMYGNVYLVCCKKHWKKKGNTFVIRDVQTKERSVAIYAGLTIEAGFQVGRAFVEVWKQTQTRWHVTSLRNLYSM